MQLHLKYISQFWENKLCYFKQLLIFSSVANLTTAQDKLEDVNEYEDWIEDGYEVVIEHIPPANGGVEQINENFTIDTKNDLIMDHSFEPGHKGEFVYVIFH